MKKNKLIEMLNSIEGNPEIFLWNGYVSDYMDIDKLPVPTSLVKMTWDNYLDLYKLRYCRDSGVAYDTLTLSDEKIKALKTRFNNFEWEINPYVSEKEIESKLYKKKDVLILNSK